MARLTAHTGAATHDAARLGRHAATSTWTTALARLGYATKGLVYVIIGALAARVAIGDGGATTDRNGALRAIYEQPFGRFLLVVVAIGLFGYALWSFIRAIVDPEGEGHEGKGLVTRIAYGAVGVSYAALAFAATGLVGGTGNGGQSSDKQTQDWTAHLLKLPFGTFVVVLVGLAVIGVALFLFYRAYKAEFQKRLDLAQLNGQGRQWVVNLGRFGYAALGVVFCIIGVFLIEAALRHNAGQAKGLGGSLSELAHQPYGHVLLGVVAIGLVAYGIYSFAQARYRRIGSARA